MSTKSQTSKAEDSQAILEQLMRDMQAQLPKLRMAVAEAYAHKRAVERDCKEVEEELARAKRPSRKKRLEGQLQDQKMRLDVATWQAERTQQMLDDYVHKMDAVFTEIRQRLPQRKKQTR